MTGKVWFITASARGLGREIAEAALRAGDRVAATTHGEGCLDGLARSYGSDLLPLPLDVTDPAAARRAVDEAVRAFGRIDVVVNNAGHADPESAPEAVGDTHLSGVVNVTRAALPVLRRQGNGHLLTLSEPGLSPGHLADVAVSGFSEVLAREVAPLGIKVTVIEPGGSGSRSRSRSRQEDFPRASDDPANVADTVRHLVELDEPPIRVLLGPDAAAQPTAVVRRHLDEVVNGGDVGLVDELWAEDLHCHGGILGECHGLAEWKGFMAANRGALADLRLDVKDVVASGDKVVVRFVGSAIHSRAFLGVPATGKKAEWLGIGIYTVRDGKITDAWFGEDWLGMLLQLGVVTLPTA
ncbi:SDR family NAD(P)-dependent oxidoreductase [Streptomyces syringium]|uniref:SDR family NAD(P)-dependent oxidoreductase n=1 Tax=Streptomyces syringium TaxID=76729 RepID=UPI003D8BB3B9